LSDDSHKYIIIYQTPHRHFILFCLLQQEKEEKETSHIIENKMIKCVWIFAAIACIALAEWYDDVDITGVDKVALLRCLWRDKDLAAFYRYNPEVPRPTFDEDKAKMAINKYIDYFAGKAIKLDLSKNIVNPYLYDCDTYPGNVADCVGAVFRQAPMTRPEKEYKIWKEENNIKYLD
jgi:hypothetical protein